MSPAGAAAQCNVLIVDDNAFDTSVIRKLVETAVEPDEAVCARTIEEAVSAVERFQPALVILDDHLGPVTRAGESISRLRAAGCSSLICVATAFLDPAGRNALLRNAGVLYFDKDEIDGAWLTRMIYLARHTDELWSLDPPGTPAFKR
jgi:CheY-like chemotaxis protein